MNFGSRYAIILGPAGGEEVAFEFATDPQGVALETFVDQYAPRPVTEVIADAKDFLPPMQSKAVKKAAAGKNVFGIVAGVVFEVGFGLFAKMQGCDL